MSLHMRQQLLKAAKLHAQSHVEKHRANVEVYLTNPVGVGEHPDIMEAIEKELEEMAKYDDHLEVLNKYFPEAGPADSPKICNCGGTCDCA
tara:strand:- start:1465 stop:1737 length:273 start_codon:yes stop_codon:yes gene_type:complete